MPSPNYEILKGDKVERIDSATLLATVVTSVNNLQNAYREGKEILAHFGMPQSPDRCAVAEAFYSNIPIKTGLKASTSSVDPTVG